MNILLVNPAPKDPYTVDAPALGLCYLSSYLKQRGISNIRGIDLNIDSQSELSSEIDKADVVGIYCSTKALSMVRKIAAQAKERGKTVVLGGPHPSVLPSEVLSIQEVDFVVLSEGEESFHDLLGKMADGSSDFSKIDGIGYKRDGAPHIHPKTRYIRNLDDIPFPDRGIFRFDQENYLSVCATRGCPYKCANCQPALSLQTCAFRMRSVGNIVSEIALNHRGKRVHFVDNDMTVNHRWIRSLCEAFISEKLDITWECQGRANTLDRELMILMRDAGCFSVGLGIESASQQMLDGFLRKQISLEKVKKLLDEAPSTGMRIHGWFIIGIPTETRADIEKTIRFATENEFASVGFSIGTPWPGTMFEIVSRKNGWIDSEDWDGLNEKRFSMIRTPEWGPEDISRYREQIIGLFRKKGWILHENDFMFGNPYWGDNILVKTLKRPVYKAYFMVKAMLGPA